LRFFNSSMICLFQTTRAPQKAFFFPPPLTKIASVVTYSANSLSNNKDRTESFAFLSIHVFLNVASVKIKDRIKKSSAKIEYSRL